MRTNNAININIDIIYRHNKNILQKFIKSNFNQIPLEDAENLVQDTFYEVLKKQDNVDFDESIIGLLYVICQRQALDYLKKKSNINEIPISRLNSQLYNNINSYLYSEYEDN